MYTPFETLNLNRRFVCVIGSGGKTTFLSRLARHLGGSVILTTSTHFQAFPDIPLVLSGTEEQSFGSDSVFCSIRSALRESRILCLGQMTRPGKLAAPTDTVSFDALLNEADHVIVEADGSRRLPLKAHRSFEPVIPDCSELTVLIAGASGIGKPIGEVCHCPELFAAIAGASTEEPVRIEHIAKVINHENLADLVLINQIDTLTDPQEAVRLCNLILKPASICSLNAWHA